MGLVGRKFSGASYRYGFNGKEKDNEIKGDANQQDYGMRIYDPRLGRFLSVDPLIHSFPSLTPYQFASNTPIQAIDLDGAEGAYHNSKTGETLVGPVNHQIIEREQGWSCNPCNPLPSPKFFELQKAANIPIPKPREEEIIVQDIYGTSHFGKRSVVLSRVSEIKQEYNQAVGENIRGGLFGAVGYHLGGDRGSFVGASVDGIAFSFSGIPEDNSSVLSGPKDIYNKNNIVNSGSTLFFKPLNNEPRSFQDLLKNPGSIWGRSKEEVGKILGEDWQLSELNSGDGWKYIQKNGDGFVSFTTGNSQHPNSMYYKINSGIAGKNKVINPSYKPTKGDKSKINIVVE